MKITIMLEGIDVFQADESFFAVKIKISHSEALSGDVLE